MDLEDKPRQATSLADLIATRPRPIVKKHRSERGDLLDYFHTRVLDKKGKPFRLSHLATKLAHLEVRDLYFLKSTCDDAANRGKPFSAVFWWSIKAK